MNDDDEFVSHAAVQFDSTSAIACILYYTSGIMLIDVWSS